MFSWVIAGLFGLLSLIENVMCRKSTAAATTLYLVTRPNRSLLVDRATKGAHLENWFSHASLR